MITLTLFLAQTEPLIDPGVQQLVQLGLGVSAFMLLAWLIKHVTTKTIPNMNAAQREQNRLQLEAFERINKEQRQEFRDILESDRQRHLAREKALHEQFSSALDRIEKRSSDGVAHERQ